MDPVSTNNASSLQQIMLMMQQFAQSNAANLENTDAAAGNTDTSGNNQTTAANNNLLPNAPAIGGDALLVLLQGQSVTPSDAGSASGQSASQQSTFGQDFQQLVQSIQSGNLSDAQQAYTAVSQDIAGQSQNGQTADPNNPFLQALNQIGSDLQSGNLTGAQQTLSSMQQGMNQNGGSEGLTNALDTAGGSSGADSSTASTTIVNETMQVNADGSTTTVTTYADGTTSTTTTPGTPQTANNTTGSTPTTPGAPQTTSATGSNDLNSLESLLAALQQGISV